MAHKPQRDILHAVKTWSSNELVIEKTKLECRDVLENNVISSLKCLPFLEEW